MSIRRLLYKIDYYHILTFSEEYKRVVSPYFGFENVEYTISNENTINENIKLTFKSENFAFFLRKEGVAFVYEGNSDDLQESTGFISTFFDIYEKIKSMDGYNNSLRHSIEIYDIDLMDKGEIEKELENSTILSINPFGKLDDFACTYEKRNEDSSFMRYQIGNFNEKDIKVRELSPFNTDFNKDLFLSDGLMHILFFEEIENNFNYKKFKLLLKKAKSIINDYKSTLNR